MTAQPDVMAVVVHHRRLDVVFDTVESIIDAGVAAEHVVVVDTSEDPAVSDALAGARRAWTLVVMDNRGYGAAVNHALSTSPLDLPLTVVLTHESRCGAADLTAMADTVRNDPRVAVAGPDFLMADGTIWSRGGRLTRLLRLPRHRTHGTPSPEATSSVEWLDGAIAVYRTEALRQFPFREDFFLYMEETELHSRLRRSGWEVVTASGSTATQSSAGMPAYWGVRNTFVFQAAHGSGFSRAVASVYVLARTCAEMVARGRGRAVGDAFRGFRDGFRHSRELRARR